MDCGSSAFAAMSERGLSLTRYLFLLWSFLRTSFIADVEYRFNFFMRIFTDILWYASHITIFEILFRQAPNLGGWTIEQTRVFLGVLFVADGIWMVLFSENLEHFGAQMRKGDFDLLLTKPINSLFMISTRKMSTAFFANTLMGMGWLIFSVSQIQDLETYRLLWLLLLIPASVILVYCVRMAFNIISIIFVDADNLVFIWYQLYKLGTRPDSIYPRWMRYLLLSVFPVGFVASVPARMVLGLGSPWLALAGVVIAGVALYLTSRFWLYGLSKYSSASS